MSTKATKKRQILSVCFSKGMAADTVLSLRIRHTRVKAYLDTVRAEGLSQTVYVIVGDEVKPSVVWRKDVSVPQAKRSSFTGPTGSVGTTGPTGRMDLVEGPSASGRKKSQNER